METLIGQAPHLLFKINKQGCSPLDIAINEQQDQKAMKFIEYMESFAMVPGLKFIKSPNRLEMRFEKPFTLSVLRNNLTLIQSFPEGSIRTCYVNMS